LLGEESGYGIFRCVIVSERERIGEKVVAILTNTALR
jgi:hypothetical protein